MIQFRKPLIRLFFWATILSMLVQVVEATTMNFTVQGDEEVTRSISLEVDDRVLIKFTVVGQTTSTLNFYMSYPNGTVKDFGKVGSVNYPFVCEVSGKYVLHFSNVDSSGDKLVTLDYEIQHYILGIPQMLFLAIVIVLICLAAVAAFIFMGKPR